MLHWRHQGVGVRLHGVWGEQVGLCGTSMEEVRAICKSLPFMAIYDCMVNHSIAVKQHYHVACVHHVHFMCINQQNECVLL